MADDDQVVETPDTAEASTEATDTEGYETAVNPEGDTGQDVPDEEDAETTQTPKADDEDEPKDTEEVKEPVDEDPDVVLDLGGKEFPGKQSELIKKLEQAQSFDEREKSLLGDYTRKTQALAEDRKSFETAFGQMPSNDELKALGQIYRDYLSNPQVKEVIDSVLSGTVDSLRGPQQVPKVESENPELQPLYDQMAKIQQSIEQQGVAMQRQQTEHTNQVHADRERQAQQTYNAWVASKKEEGLEISEEIHSSIGPWIEAARRSNPQWDDRQVLNEALRHVRIDDVHKDAVKTVHTKKEKAKTIIPRMKPKVATKSDKEESYADILNSA